MFLMYYHICNTSSRLYCLKAGVLYPMCWNKIINGDFIWLDIVKMKWKIGYYRCRIGKIRIIFFEKESKYFVEKIGYRWDVYK